MEISFVLRQIEVVSSVMTMSMHLKKQRQYSYSPVTVYATMQEGLFEFNSSGNNHDYIYTYAI